MSRNQSRTDTVTTIDDQDMGEREELVGSSLIQYQPPSGHQLTQPVRPPRVGDVTSANDADTTSTRMDMVLLVTVLVMVGFGIVMVFSSSTIYALDMHNNPLHYLRQQSIYAMLGLLAMMVGATIHYSWWKRLAMPLLLLAISTLAILLIPGIGITVNNSTRWFSLGPVRFQPTELAKLALVIYLAASLVNKGKKIRSLWTGFIPHMLVCLVIVFLCMQQPDLGSSALMMWLMLWMLYVGGTKLLYLASLFGISLPVLYAAIQMSQTRMDRITAFRNPWEHRFDIGYHIVNSIIGIGSGGITGLGLGESRQKLHYLPEAHTDFILAIIGEELGLIGIIALVILFIMFVWRGIRIAMRSRDDFGTYLAFGITFLIAMQAVINMGVVTAVLPTKGLTLPFISSGGSSLIVCMFMAGILLNISLGIEDDWAERVARRNHQREFTRVLRRNMVLAPQDEPKGNLSLKKDRSLK